MKSFLVITAMAGFSSFSTSHTISFTPNDKDTTGNHITDGSISEWPAGAFHPDNDTTVFTAVDHDNEQLYIALTIPDFSMQSKLMRNGMKLFIDAKAKKKENHGVEFPIGEIVNNFMKESFPAVSPGISLAETNADHSKKEMDKKAMRNIMSLGLTALKTFGIGESAEQGLTVPGSVNIAFKWDADDSMHIEYNIPLKLLGLSTADKKDIDIGWTVNGFQSTEEKQMSTGGRHGGGHHGGFSNGMSQSQGSGIGFNNAPGRPQRRMSMAEMMKEQSFWMKYELPGKKAF